MGRRKAKAKQWTRRKRPAPPPAPPPTPAEERVLKNIYYGYGQEGALVNTRPILYRLAKAELPTVTRKDVDQFLKKQASYTVHRRLAKKHFPRRRIRVPAPRVRVDADLIDLVDLAPWNGGYKYVLNAIDTFTKYIWAIPQKDKESKTTAASFQTMMKATPPLACEVLYTDAGTEFLGPAFQRLIKEHGISHKICGGEQFHCPFTERANRTLKEKLFQAMTAETTRRWVRLLPLIVDTYNKTVHSTTGMRPGEVGDEDALDVYEKTHPPTKPPKQPPKFKVGDYVRILKLPGPFDKGYLPRFTWEIFQVAGLQKGGWPYAYYLKDLNGEQIKRGVFYEPELSAVDPSLLGGNFPVREILARRNGGREVLVWWQGLPRSQAEWIPTTNLVPGGERV